MPGPVSSKGRHALHIMVDLATHKGYVSLADISARQNVSKKYLEQIMPLLVDAGYVKSKRGKMGGYALAKDPADCVVGSILRVAESGSLAPLDCLDCGSLEPCPKSNSCATQALMKGLGQVQTKYLDSQTIKDMI